MKDKNEKLKEELQEAYEILKIVQLWNPLPDLSEQKFYNAFRYLEPIINSAVKRLENSGFVEVK